MPVSFLTDEQLACFGRYAGPPQLCTVRYLGTFLEDCLAVPGAVVAILARHLNIADRSTLPAYAGSRQRIEHAREIQTRFGYRDFADPAAGYHLTRWLYALCWTGTERPGAVFERATAWLFEHEVLLPGATVLERFVSRLRQRVETRLWRLLCAGLSLAHRT